MKKYLLDNGALVALVKGRPGAERLIRPWVEHDEAATSILAYGEAIECFRSLPDFPHQRSNLRALLRGVTPYGITYAIMERYSDPRARAFRHAFAAKRPDELTARPHLAQIVQHRYAR